MKVQNFPLQSALHLFRTVPQFLLIWCRILDVAESSYKTKYDGVSAKYIALQAEHETLKSELTKSHKVQSQVETKLDTRMRVFQASLSKKDEQISKCEDAVKKLCAELDKELRQAKWVDEEILGKYSRLHDFRVVFFCPMT